MKVNKYQGLVCSHHIIISIKEGTSQYLCLILSSENSPVSPLVDLLPLYLGPETMSQSLKELRLC